MKSKFKVGDLVMLSAAGKRVDQNSYAVGGWGIIREIVDKSWRHNTKSSDYYPIKAQWYNGDRFGEDWTRSMRYKPYELKFFKKFT